jgi:hypothetical protein
MAPRLVSALSPATADRGSGFVATIELLDGTLSGIRRGQAPGYTLLVLAGPFSQLHVLKSLLPEVAVYRCYLIHGKVVYVGHGNNDRKIGDRLAADHKENAQVYVIYSLDSRFDKAQAGYLEARLMDRLFVAGAPLANVDRPFGSGLKEDPGLEQIVRQSELLLGVAGFRPLECVGATALASRTLPGARILEDVVPVEPDQMPPLPDTRYRLHCRGLSAEGFYSGPKIFFVQPGADYALGVRRGMTEHNKARRQGIEKFLEPVHGAEHRMRLRVGLRCLSAPIAAKLLSGEHVGRKVWQPIA